MRDRSPIAFSNNRPIFILYGICIAILVALKFSEVRPILGSWIVLPILSLFIVHLCEVLGEEFSARAAVTTPPTGDEVTKQHYENYVAHNKAVRTWFLSFGLGAVVLFMLHPQIAYFLSRIGRFLEVVMLIGVGSLLQVFVALLNKWLSWRVYNVEKGGAQFAPDKLAFWWRFDLAIDITTFVYFVAAAGLMIFAFTWDSAKNQVSPSDELQAFKAAYQNEDRANAAIDREPLDLISVKAGIRVLLVKGRVLNCAQCNEVLDVFYMRRVGNAFEVLREWRDIGRKTQLNFPPRWTFSPDTESRQAFRITSTAGGGGCGAPKVRTIELGNLRPEWRCEYSPLLRGNR